jgi:hypothetical protein
VVTAGGNKSAPSTRNVGEPLRPYRIANSAIYHRKRDSIEAHLTIVMAALAVSHWLECVTGWSIKKLVQTLRRYRSIAVQTGDHILHAGTSLEDDARAAINAVKAAAAGH